MSARTACVKSPIGIDPFLFILHLLRPELPRD